VFCEEIDLNAYGDEEPVAGELSALALVEQHMQDGGYHLGQVQTFHIEMREKTNLHMPLLTPLTCAGQLLDCLLFDKYVGCAFTSLSGMGGTLSGVNIDMWAAYTFHQQGRTCWPNRLNVSYMPNVVYKQRPVYL
jgi:hypothetical protein